MAGNLYEQGYYETGTASVTQGQTVVTGQGTAWLQIVRPADDFGKHVGMPIPIASVDSDTQITLAYPWPGPTQAAAPYRVTFTPYHVAYRQALQEIGQLLSTGNVSALAGLVGEAGKFPVFTGAGAMDLANLSDYAGTGDVKGPANSTDSNVALFDGATGKLLKDGFPVSAFMRTVLDDADATTARGTLSVLSRATSEAVAGRKQFSTGAQGNNGIGVATSGLGEFEVAGNGTGAAVFAFHRPGSRAIYFGLDTDGKLKRGGWSDGANAYMLYDEESAIGAGGLLEHISNANGISTRFKSGLLLQRSPTLSLGYQSPNRLGATWTFPAEFAGTYAPVVVADGVGNLANDEFAFFFSFDQSTTTQCRISAISTGVFDAGDSLPVRVIAMGEKP